MNFGLQKIRNLSLRLGKKNLAHREIPLNDKYFWLKITKLMVTEIPNSMKILLLYNLSSQEKCN